MGEVISSAEVARNQAARQEAVGRNLDMATPVDETPAGGVEMGSVEERRAQSDKMKLEIEKTQAQYDLKLAEGQKQVDDLASTGKLSPEAIELAQARVDEEALAERRRIAEMKRRKEVLDQSLVV